MLIFPSNPPSCCLAAIERKGGHRRVDQLRTRDKLAGPKLLVCVVERGKCYLIFQLTITITVDISVDNNNCPYTGQLLK